MANNVEVVMTAKDAEMVQAWMRGRDSIKAYQDQLAALGGEEQRTADEARKMAAAQKQAFSEAAKIADQLRTPLQKYEDKMNRLRELNKTAGLSPIAFEKQAARYRNEYEQDTGQAAARDAVLAEASERAARSQKKKADAIREAHRVMVAVATPMEKYLTEVARLDYLSKKAGLSHEAYQRAVKAAKDELNRATAKPMPAVDDGMLTRLAAYAAGWLSIGTLISRAATERERLDNRAADVANRFDRSFREFRLQSDLGPDQAETAKQNIIQAANRYGTPIDAAASTATALVSTGFAPNQASGDALRKVLAAVAAQGIQLNEQVGKQLAEGVSATLSANNMELSAENIQRVAKINFALKELPIKITDLNELGKQAGSLKAFGASIEEQFSAMGFLMQRGKDGGEAMTSIRNIMSRIGTMDKSTKEDRDLLRMLKLKQTDVDFVGEDFGTVLQTLKTALDKLPQEKRQLVGSKLAEAREYSSLYTLMQGIDEYRAILNKAKNPGDFSGAVAVGSSGRAKAAQRAMNAEEVSASQRDRMTDVYKQMQEAVDNEQNASPLSRMFKRFVISSLTNVFGMEPALAYEQETTSRVSEAMKSSLDENTKATEELTKAIKGMGGNQGRNGNSTGKPNTNSPARPPSADLSGIPTISIGGM